MSCNCTRDWVSAWQHASSSQRRVAELPGKELADQIVPPKPPKGSAGHVPAEAAKGSQAKKGIKIVEPAKGGQTDRGTAAGKAGKTSSSSYERSSDTEASSSVVDDPEDFKWVEWGLAAGPTSKVHRLKNGHLTACAGRGKLDSDRQGIGVCLVARLFLGALGAQGAPQTFAPTPLSRSPDKGQGGRLPRQERGACQRSKRRDMTV